MNKYQVSTHKKPCERGAFFWFRCNGLVDGSAELCTVQESVILFDGVCNLCNGLVQFVLKRDKKRRFKFGSLQSAAARRLLSRFSHLDVDTVDSFVLIDAGHAYTKADAGLRVMNRLGGIYKLFGVGFLLPRALRNGVYDFIARNRYKWFGKRDACMIPDEPVADRFID